MEIPGYKILNILGKGGMATVYTSDNDHSMTKRPVLPLAHPTYMSPEQAQGKSVDKRTDIYSPGIRARAKNGLHSLGFYGLLDGSNWVSN